jgi:hypothetical protein
VRNGAPTRAIPHYRKSWLSLYNRRESQAKNKEEAMKKRTYTKIQTIETKQDTEAYPHNLFTIQEAAAMCDMSTQGIDYRVAHKGLPIYYEPAVRLRGAMIHIEDIKRIRKERGLNPDPRSDATTTTESDS